jgi:hypothetical protein
MTLCLTAVSHAVSCTGKSAFHFDVFLSHDWGKDERNRDNHQRVAKINELLKARGFRTWFDNDRMTGDIVAQMCDGVEKSALFVSFITSRYVSKVAILVGPSALPLFPTTTVCTVGCFG